MNVRRVELSVPVAVDGVDGSVACAVTVVVPAAILPGPVRFAFCFAGGGYDRGYYDRHFAGRVGYSMAEHLADRGIVSVLCDHLGVGGSSHPPRPERLDVRTLADADAQVVRRVRERMRAGLLAELAGREQIVVGVGHSMAGGLLVLQQCAHRTFDALVVMGWSAVHTPSSVDLATREGWVLPEPGPAPLPRHPGYATNPRGELQHRAYHWPDVPADVVERDDALAVEFPPTVRDMNLPGALAVEAAAIAEPLLLIFGERDLREPGVDEAAPYRSASRVEVLELAASGHCHAMAGSRRLAWDRIADWIGAVRAGAGVAR